MPVVTMTFTGGQRSLTAAASFPGLTTFEPSIAGKWFSMLKEVVPQIKRAAFMSNPNTSSYDYYLRAAQAAAASLNIELLASPVTNTAEITNLIESFARVSSLSSTAI
jgi:putative tryptophan/tyrosine transport system substrate-binding protein